MTVLGGCSSRTAAGKRWQETLALTVAPLVELVAGAPMVVSLVVTAIAVITIEAVAIITIIIANQLFTAIFTESEG